MSRTPAEEDTIVGHEFVGVVESVGEGVRRVEPGMRCLASMFTACGRCPSCVAGNHLGCDRYALFGYGDLFRRPGRGQAEYVRVPIADMTLFPVPDNLTDEQVLFVGDVLATAYTGCVEGRIQHGRSSWWWVRVRSANLLRSAPGCSLPRRCSRWTWWPTVSRKWPRSGRMQRSEMVGRLDGKVAIVTGAARGQGDAEARLFAAEGARLVLGDVRKDQFARARGRVGARRQRRRRPGLRRNRRTGWASAVQIAELRFGRLDVLVNNARDME
ncbi:SDR family NAD(P)-dependent oxidoreductase [Amycolatopsis nalaikhensis]|uniref:SDR family NAD(P)-dependent oxidoreductase n=1 Tax=Amycolatopsis nalaikhensis TaxID=715472 RepID=UPI00331E7CB8